MNCCSEKGISGIYSRARVKPIHCIHFGILLEFSSPSELDVWRPGQGRDERGGGRLGLDTADGLRFRCRAMNVARVKSSEADEAEH